MKLFTPEMGERLAFFRRAATIMHDGALVAGTLGRHLAKIEPGPGSRLASSMVDEFDRSQALVADLLVKLREAYETLEAVHLKASDAHAALEGERWTHQERIRAEIEERDKLTAEVTRLRAELVEKDEQIAACEPDITRAVEKFTALAEACHATQFDLPASELQSSAAKEAVERNQAGKSDVSRDWGRTVALDAIACFALKLVELIESESSAPGAP